MTTTKKLLNLKERIEEARSEASELKGQQKHLMKQLEDWGCTSVKQAKEKAKELDKKINQLSNKIDQGVEELEEQYDE